MDTLKRVAVASERPVHPRVGEGFAGDKFRVSGTKEVVERAGANKVSEVLSEANCYRCGTSNFTKKSAFCSCRKPFLVSGGRSCFAVLKTPDSVAYRQQRGCLGTALRS